MAQAASPTDSIFELGKLYFERCDFLIALEKFEQAAESYLAEKDFEKFLKCQNHILRIYAEQEQNEKIGALKERLQDIVLKEGFELNSKTYYTLGICASYKGQFDVAQDYFQKALNLALIKDSKSDICYAINGLAITYYHQNKLHEALKEIYNLQVFFQVMPMPDIQLSSQMLNGHILRKLRKYEQAQEILWQCYDILREEKNMFMYLCLLLGLALVYKDAGDLDMARMYLRLAKKSIDPVNLKVLAKQVDHQLAELGVANSEEFDLIFDANNHSVVEKKKGTVDFKNQFILLDMLRMFMKNPGEVYSKESLVQKIWKQEYDPAVHDNKIYVTIKRLRKMIEPDYDKPKYIFRAKNGYYLNKNTRVYLG